MFTYHVVFQHGSRDVLVLLAREAEDAVTMITETGHGSPSRHIVLDHLTSAAYIATLPSKCVSVHVLVCVAMWHTDWPLLRNYHYIT